MKSADYDKLFAELLGPFPVLDDPIRKQFEDMTASDLARIIPLIDDMVKQAENRGKLSVYLELAAERLKDGQRKRDIGISTAN